MKIVIAHFNSAYVRMPGGVEKVTCSLANALHRRGHEVTILFRDSKLGRAYFPLDEGIPEHNILYNDEGVRTIQDKLPAAIRLKREFFRLFSAKKAHEINAVAKGRFYGPAIRKWLDRIHPDVIIATSMPSAKYVIEDAAAEVPVITMIHSQPSVQFAAISPAERRAVSHGAGIQILLPSGIEETRRVFPNLPIHVIGNAVEIPDWQADLGREKERYHLVCVGTVNPNKNQKLVVEAFASLADRFLDWDVELWGKADERYARPLREYIKKHQLEGRVFFKGLTKNVDGDIYRRADLFAIPSKKEGFPLSLTEAMAAGFPAVGLRTCPGVNELIEDGQTGYLVNESPAAMADALACLMGDRALRVRMGQAGREAVQVYAADRIWDQWERLLEETAGKV